MLTEVQARLRLCVADVDTRPRFLTAESWMVEQMEQLPVAKALPSRVDVLPHARGMGRSPEA
jgi:hypothetical protein